MEERVLGTRPPGRAAASSPELKFVAPLRTLPKIELHCHLEATMSAELVRRLATRNALIAELPTALAAYEPTQDLTAYLDGYDACARTLRTPDDFAEAVDAYLEDAAAQGVCYAELFWSPMVHLDTDVSYPTQLNGIRAGLAQSSSGVECRLIPAIDRTRPPAQAHQLLDMILADRDEHVVGLGLDYDETLGTARAFAGVFHKARTAGLHATSHAGETADAASVRDSIEFLGCERIDHGYTVLGDAAVTQLCLDRQVTFAVSNTAAELLDTWGVEHLHSPIAMWNRGLRITPGTDAPAHFSNTMTNEFEALRRGGLSDEELANIVRGAVSATFLDTTDRRRLQQHVDIKLQDWLPSGESP